MPDYKDYPWRRTYDSPFLASWDITDGKDIIRTISRVEVKDVPGHGGKVNKCNVVHFKEGGKPMIFNVTASKIMEKICNTIMLGDWVGHRVSIYVGQRYDKVLKENYPALMIRDKEPKNTKPELTKTHKAYPNAVKKYKEDKNFTVIEQHYTLNDTIKNEIKKAASS